MNPFQDSLKCAGHARFTPYYGARGPVFAVWARNRKKRFKSVILVNQSGFLRGYVIKSTLSMCRGAHTGRNLGG